METRYETTVPDTLDLADKARLGVNGITGMIEPRDFEMYGWIFFDRNPPIMTRHMNASSTLMSKCLEALPMLRLMSGSRQSLDLEAGSLDFILRHISEEDGLYWSVATDENWAWHSRVVPPHLGGEFPTQPTREAHVDYAAIVGQLRTLRTLMAWYQYTGDDVYRDKADRMIDGIDKRMCVHRDDYAYFPAYSRLGEARYLGACYTRDGWSSDREPADEHDSADEGSVILSYGIAPGVLSLWYRLTGNEQALRLAGEFARFVTKEKMWGIDDDPFGDDRGARDGHWDGHGPGHLEALRALLDYALVTNDARLKDFVRTGFEWGLNWIDRPTGHWGRTCGCNTPRLVALAIKLTEAGLGDYWEFVDRWVRNHLVETQMTDAAGLEAFARSRPQYTIPDRNYETDERVAARAVGCFSTTNSATATLIGQAFSHLCCTPHGNMGLFYAWDASVRHSSGTVWVNLLLNRASPWLDVDSYLPHEGKVVIKNKTAETVCIRMPVWADKKAVRCSVDGAEVARPVRWDQYLMLRGVTRGSDITVTFPMRSRSERFGEHTAQFRGNTVLDISPRDETGGYSIYNREHLAADRAPMATKTRYVTDSRLEVW